MSHVPRLFGGILENLLSTLGRRHIAENESAPLLGNALFNFQLQLYGIYVHALQRLVSDSFPFLYQGEDDMFGKELLGVKTLRLFLGDLRQDPLSSLGQPLKH